MRGRFLPRGLSVGGFFTTRARAAPQLAGACLLYLANRDGLRDLFTVDRRDFAHQRV